MHAFLRATGVGEGLYAWLMEMRLTLDQ